MNHIETLWESKISGCKSTGCFIAMFRLPCPNISLHGSPNQSLWSVNVCGGRSLPKPVGFRMVCDLPWTVESYFKCLYFSLKRRCCLETRIQPSQNFLLTSIFWKERKKNQPSNPKRHTMFLLDPIKLINTFHWVFPHWQHGRWSQGRACQCRRSKCWGALRWSNTGDS